MKDFIGTVMLLLTPLLALAIGLSGLGISGASPGASLSAVCNAPAGPRVDYGRSDANGRQGPPRMSRSEDEITGVTPTFFIDLGTRNQMTVVIGSTTYPGMTREQVEKIAPTEAKTLPIIHASEHQISAIESSSNGVWLYSLFPELGFGLISRQTHWTGGGNAIGSLMFTMCRFQKGQP